MGYDQQLPVISITETLIRINATAVIELLPEEVFSKTHAVTFDLDDGCEKLTIGFVDREKDNEKTPMINLKMEDVTAEIPHNVTLFYENGVLRGTTGNGIVRMSTW